MKRTFINIALLIGLALAVASCRVKPVYNVDEATLPIAAGHSLEEISQAIKLAGSGLGWEVKEKSSGHNVGTLHLREHKAVVDITYTTEDFSIKYKNSVNLKYDGTKIHQNYNGWIQNLERAIIARTSAL